MARAAINASATRPSSSRRGRSVRLAGVVWLDVLERRLLPRLRGVLGTGRDLLAAMFLFLLHFFVVRDIAWIGHRR